MGGMPCFTCPACSATSYNENDIAAGYCGRCHWYTGDPMLAWQRPELFTAHGATPPARPAGPGPGYALTDAQACNVAVASGWIEDTPEARAAYLAGKE